jgi:hypothetical protein
VSFHVLDELDGLLLREGAVFEKLTQAKFYGVCDGVYGAKLRPEVFFGIAATHAEGDEVVDFEVFAAEGMNGEVKGRFVTGEDLIFGFTGDVATAVGNFFGVSVFVRSIAEGTGG